MDTSSLTTRERQQWADLVSELVAPCPDQAMTLARCVDTHAPCRSCASAARMLVYSIEKGLTRDQAKEAYRIRYSPEEVRAIALDGSPARGATHPVVTIVEWADFECPFCAISARALHGLVNKYPDRVRVVFKHYPLNGHPNANDAARAAVAADLQGRFWLMHDRLFASQQAGVDAESIRSIAREIGLDEAAFARDSKGPQASSVLLRDRQQADQLQLKGTPLIYVNGRRFDLNLFDLGQDLESWVQQEIALASESRAGSVPARSIASPTPESGAPAEPTPAQVGGARTQETSSPAPQSATVPAREPEEEGPERTTPDKKTTGAQQ